jgi:hypothetical protein
MAYLVELEKNVLHCLPLKNVIVSPNDSLMAASKLLILNKLHRLPIIDSMPNSDQVLSVLTQIKILRFIASTQVWTKCSSYALLTLTHNNLGF